MLTVQSEFGTMIFGGACCFFLQLPPAIEELMDDVRTGAVIVAAGKESPPGGFMPMKKIGAIPVVQRIIANFQQAKVFPIVLVTGFRGRELEREISGKDIVFIRNGDYEKTEMFDSAKLGLSFIMDKCDRTFFSPADIPLFTRATTSRLLKTKSEVAVPVCGEKSGHPVLLSSRIIPDLLGYGGRGGLKGAIQSCGSPVRKVVVADEGILMDAEGPGDYGELLARHNSQLLRPQVEISLMGENRFLDKDGAMLLNMIGYTGSVKEACRKMQISYSKAWGILSSMEENLGIRLLDRRPGGETGGGSRLTPEGRRLLANYMALTKKVRDYADLCFRECFNGELP